jgi:hypothetical protein
MKLTQETTRRLSRREDLVIDDTFLIAAQRHLVRRLRVADLEVDMRGQSVKPEIGDAAPELNLPTEDAHRILRLRNPSQVDRWLSSTFPTTAKIGSFPS